MPAPHYAISEALIVLAAIGCCTMLARQRMWSGMAGIGLLGAAAAIGIYRFGANEIDALAGLHRNFSQIGGAIASALIAAQLAASWTRWVTLIALAVTGIALAFAPDSASALFLIWLAVAAIAAWIGGTSRAAQWTNAVIIAAFAPNLLLIRRAAWLNPDASWHLFHTFVALWLVGASYVMLRSKRRATIPTSYGSHGSKGKL